VSFFLVLLKGGWAALLDYLSAHVLTCLVPAFFIAGAIAVFLSQKAILRYFGPKSSKVVSYGVASVSGTILAVCSCTVYKRGAGIGPATAFLYSGPAINVLAIVYSARLLGWELGLARVVGAVIFSVVIGLIMSVIWQRREPEPEEGSFDFEKEESARPLWKSATFFALLVVLLILAAGHGWVHDLVKLSGLKEPLSYWLAWIPAILALASVVITVIRWFKKGEFRDWMCETWRFVKMIFPWLLGGVFVAGILKVLVPDTWIAAAVGGNSILSNLVASIFGALMYFATLTEVPIIKAFTEMGMGQGPALALLLAGPALSLPNMLVIRRIMGWSRTLTYISLVVVMATFTGWIFGLLRG
jgi:uncharacterized membrane protein YraQ (UPF0718 family)